MKRKPASRLERGLSLLELILFIVIVSVGVAGVLSVLDIGARASADPLVRKQALMIATAMLEEVLAKDYENDPGDPGNVSATLGCTSATTPRCAPNTPGERPNYNDLDDYQGWDQGAVYQLDGTPAPVVGSYRVRVAVAATTISGVAGKGVTVTVDGANETIVISGFRASI